VDSAGPLFAASYRRQLNQHVGIPESLISAHPTTVSVAHRRLGRSFGSDEEAGN
jgi:hypothetical protein